MFVIRGELDQETAALKSTAAVAGAFLERRRPSPERARRYHLGAGFSGRRFLEAVRRTPIAVVCSVRRRSSVEGGAWASLVCRETGMGDCLILEMRTLKQDVIQLSYATYVISGV